MQRYALKRIIRGWPLFITLMVGFLISSSTFTTINLSINGIMQNGIIQAADESFVDIEVSGFTLRPRAHTLEHYIDQLDDLEYVQSAELITRVEEEVYSGVFGPPTQVNAFVGIDPDSTAWTGITLMEGNLSLGYNQALLVSSSTDFENFSLNDIYTLTFELHYYTGGFMGTINFNLDIVGFVAANDTIIDMLVDNDWRLAPTHNLFIVNRPATLTHWQEDFGRIYNLMRLPGSWYAHDFQNFILVFTKRDEIVHPTDISMTLTALAFVRSQVQTVLANEEAVYAHYLESHIQWVYDQSQTLLSTALTTYIPLLFAIAAMLALLSDLYLRRRSRETGLLLAQGFTRPTILQLFTTEALLMGLLSGALGVLFGYVVTPLITGVSWNPGILLTIGWLPILLGVVFTCCLAVITIYPAASRATHKSTIQSLTKNNLEPIRYRKGLAYSALGLGSYKSFMWIAGLEVVHIKALVPNFGFWGEVFFMAWAIFDFVITLFAIVLLLFGLSKVAIEGSKILHRVSEKLYQRTLGDIGDLGARSLHRNPARLATVVFILALVISSSVLTVTLIASERDYTIRSLYTDVGADVSAMVMPASAAPNLLEDAKANITGILSGTVELGIWYPTSLERYIPIRGIDANQWQQTAYYEEQWFRQVSSNEALSSVGANNQSIILQFGLAQQYNISLGDTIEILNHTEPTPLVNLTVVGFFGLDQLAGTFQGHLIADFSIVSKDIFELFEDNLITARILLKTRPKANVAGIQYALENYNEISKANSVAEELGIYATNPPLSTEGHIQLMGLVIALILGTLGTFIIFSEWLREKHQETALIAARGLSTRQTTYLLWIKYASWTIFAIVIGFFAALIASNGIIQNLTPADPFVPRTLNVIFSLDVIAYLSGAIGTLLLFSLIPIIRATQQAHADIEAQGYQPDEIYHPL